MTIPLNSPIKEYPNHMKIIIITIKNEKSKDIPKSFWPFDHFLFYFHPVQRQIIRVCWNVDSAQRSSRDVVLFLPSCIRVLNSCPFSRRFSLTDLTAGWVSVAVVRILANHSVIVFVFGYTSSLLFLRVPRPY